MIECNPTDSVAVLSLAMPALNVRVPRIVAPSLNVTVPLGTPAVEVTCTVKVMFLPKGEGFADETSVVLVAALLTIWVSAEELLASHGE